MLNPAAIEMAIIREDLRDPKAPHNNKREVIHNTWIARASIAVIDPRLVLFVGTGRLIDPPTSTPLGIAPRPIDRMFLPSHYRIPATPPVL
jgi:hypothetical protein